MEGYPREQELRPKRPYAVYRPEPDWSLAERMSIYLNKRELSFGLAQFNGWYPSSKAGDSLPRVVIPATSRSPVNKFWQARVLGEGEPRYQSPPNARGDALVITRPSLPWRRVVAVVEGPMCALAAADLGMVGIAFMGSVNDELISHLAEHLCSVRTYLIADLDATDKMARIMDLLLEQFPKDTVYKISLMTVYPWKDLAEVPRKEREARFKTV